MKLVWRSRGLSEICAVIFFCISWNVYRNDDQQVLIKAVTKSYKYL